MDTTHKVSHSFDGKEHYSGLNGYMSFNRLKELMEQNNIVRSNEKIVGITVSEEGLTIHFEYK